MGKTLSLGLALIALSGLCTTHTAYADEIVFGGKTGRWNLYNNPEFAGVDATQVYVGVKMGAGAFSLTPGVHVGAAEGRDPLGDTKSDWDSFYGANIRGTIESDWVYVYVQPSYTRYDPFLGHGNTAVVSQEWEVGVNSGIGFKLADPLRVEIGYDKMEHAEGFNIGFHLTF